MKQGKWLYLEAARILAVLLVIFNHTDGFFLYYTHTQRDYLRLVFVSFRIVPGKRAPLFYDIRRLAA